MSVLGTSSGVECHGQQPAAMFKVDIPMSTREQQAIQRRRDAENERKARIFNPKHRILGVRCSFLTWPA